MIYTEDDRHEKCSGECAEIARERAVRDFKFWLFHSTTILIVNAVLFLLVYMYGSSFCTVGLICFVSGALTCQYLYEHARWWVKLSNYM